MEMTGVNINNSTNGEHGMISVENEATVEQGKKELWEKSQKSELIKRLKAGESLQKIMDSFENVEKLFTELDVIVCSDGRILPSGGAKLGIAGECILFSKEELDEFIKKYKGKIRKVTSHDDCGAAGEAFKKDSGGAATSDDLGKNFAKWLAEQLGAEYEHISEKRSEIHDERMICFDGTGKFNPAVLLADNKMPGHFVSSAYGFGLGVEYMKKELAILTGIALGHGFEKRFTKDNKFIIIISAKDDAQLAEMTEIAKEAVEKYGDRVEAKGFVHKEEA